VPTPTNDDGNNSLREDASLFLPASFFADGRFDEPLKLFVASWDAAEEAMKDAEFFRQEVVFASIKEMRYAGRRFNDALKLMLQGDAGPSHTAAICDLLREASENCIRARNDAVDALISYLYKYFRTVKRITLRFCWIHIFRNLHSSLYV
jgi:hypothetical protein